MLRNPAFHKPQPKPSKENRLWSSYYKASLRLTLGLPTLTAHLGSCGAPHVSDEWVIRFVFYSSVVGNVHIDGNGSSSKFCR